MVLLKGWFSDLEILEIYGHVIVNNRNKKASPRLKRKILKSKKLLTKSKLKIVKTKHHRPQYLNVNTEKQNKFRVNKEKHDWNEDYITISQEPRLEKKPSVETEIVNELSINIPTGDITELNELIYVGAKLVSDKNRYYPTEPDKNYKPE